LQEELTQAATQPREVPVSEEISTRLAKDVAGMQAVLGSAENDPVIAMHSDSAALSLASADASARAVLKQVETTQGPASKEGVCYDLHYNPTDQSPLLSLDRRLAALSKVILGNNRGASRSQSMIEQLSELQARLELTEEYKLDTVYRRTRSLVTEIDTVDMREDNRSPSRAALPSGPLAIGKLKELHGLMTRLQGTADSVPSTVSRLQTQKGLHETAALLLTRLQTLEQSHAFASLLIKADHATIGKLSTQSSYNVGTMATNLAHLQKRMDAIARRSK